MENSERKRADELLSPSMEEYSAAFHASPDQIVISTLREGRFIDVNDSLERTTGYSHEEMIGHTSNELGFWLKPEDRIKFVRKLRRKGFVSDLEVKLRMKSGETRVGLMSAQVINIGGEPCSVAILHDITERKQAEEELKRSREELRNLATHLQQAIEQESGRIAREIHDELGQTLTALKMDLSWLGKRLTGNKKLLEKLDAMSEQINITAQTVKNISTRLRPGLLDDLGLIAAMEWQAQQFRERTHMECELNLQASDFKLNPDLATTFFRIYQEALTNVIRHASATHVRVSLYRKANRLVLRVRDNGKGIKKEQISHPQSMGLLSMRERARFWGGDVKISGIEGRGTTVAVSIPFSLKEQK